MIKQAAWNGSCLLDVIKTYTSLSPFARFLHCAKRWTFRSRGMLYDLVFQHRSVCYLRRRSPTNEDEIGALILGSDSEVAEQLGAMLDHCRHVTIPFCGGLAILPHLKATAIVANDLIDAAIEFYRVASGVRGHVMKLKLFEMCEGTLSHPSEMRRAQWILRTKSEHISHAERAWPIGQAVGLVEKAREVPNISAACPASGELPKVVTMQRDFVRPHPMLKNGQSSLSVASGSRSTTAF